MQNGASPAPDSLRRRDAWRKRLAGLVVYGVLAAVASTLWYVERVPEPPPAPESPQPAKPGPAVPAGIGPDPVAPIGKLEARLVELEERARALRAASDDLRERLAREQASRGALTDRVRELESAAEGDAKPAPSQNPSLPQDSALQPLYDRLLQIEVGLEREGAARLQSQEELAQRMYKLEKSVAREDSARAAFQKSLEERLYNLEQRAEEIEARMLEAERRLERASP